MFNPETTIKVVTGIPILMRDGTILRADLYRPDAPGKYPVVLERTPYDRSERRGNHIVLPVQVAQRGYAVVIQDVRGRYDSEGEFNPFHQEIEDGYDTLDWCSKQEWSNGKTGMFGGSYVGATQWLAAISKHPSLTCIVPSVTSDDYYEGWTYQGGALSLGFVSSWSMFALTLQNLKNLIKNNKATELDGVSLIEAIDSMPLSLKKAPAAFLQYLNSDIAPYYYQWTAHPENDSYWRSISIAEHHGEISTPALNIGGWFDIFLSGTLRNFTGMQSRLDSNDAHKTQKLIIGPWSHTTIAAAASGSQYFGQNASHHGVDLFHEHLDWYDRWLKDEINDEISDYPVRIFVMGENVWRSEDNWPLERTEYVELYLHSNGDANTAGGDGELSTVPPLDEPNDFYTFDPDNPVPTSGGGLCCYPSLLPGGPFDQTFIENRADVLCYTTLPMVEDVEVTGHIELILYASSTALDTDFTAKLVDVCEQNDCAIGLTDGIIRAKYRDNTSIASCLNPGETYKFKIDLGATSNLFKKGHRIRLEVSSSNFPRFEPNVNNGTTSAFSWEKEKAEQKIFHNNEFQSRLIIPFIPREISKNKHTP